MKTLGHGIGTRANILIEQWSNKRFYVTKNRYSNDQKVPYEIHPNEMVKLLADYDNVVIVSQKTVRSQELAEKELVIPYSKMSEKSLSWQSIMQEV